MKLINRNQYLEKMSRVIGTPDIKQTLELDAFVQIQGFVL